MPVITMEVPKGPELGERPVIVIPSMTVNETPLLVIPPSETVTEPLVAPDGTVAVMLVLLQEVVLAVTPLNRTVLLPWLAPKPLPVSVIEPPTGPADGVKLEMMGL